MKIKIALASGLLVSAAGGAQTVIPQNIPCVIIAPPTLPFLENDIQGTDCVQSLGDVTLPENENYSIKAGEYIHFGQNTVLAPGAGHEVHAYIDNGGMEIAWYYPNATPGTVGQFEKLELGVQFNADITTRIQHFTGDPQVAPMLNPFNPEEVDLHAEFWYYFDEGPAPPAWFGPQRINGFYYEEFVRGETDWTAQPNQHDFRIRFAPRNTGLWRCKITAVVAGFGSFEAAEFTFNCVPSESKDFMRVGDNGRYFRIGDEPFFPVGHNLVWPQGSSTGPWERTFEPIVPPSFFESYHQQMEDIIANGGNYMRLINNPWSTDCEFEKLNDYSDRQVHAWEMDKILEKADQIGLHIHYDMMIQYNFEVPDPFGAPQWDWTAYGDELNNCATADDEGFCYRSALGILDPIDFFTDTDARKYYKYKLRYLIARYGYSNEIAVIELFSEINNAGTRHNMQLETVDGIYGCHDMGGPIGYKPYETDPSVPLKISLWHNEMCQYIKEGLQHTHHPLAVSYAGEPSGEDNSYQSPYVDIITYNRYQLSVEKGEYTVYDVVGYQSSVHKPFMFPEYGSGDQAGKCDQGVDFIKTLTLTPFSGAAGAAMNWDWQNTDEHFLWHHMGPVKTLMEGIPLDEEFWVPALPVVSSNKAVEVVYLRNFVPGNYRAVGAVSNRTYNYYTQGVSAPCNLLSGDVNSNPIYQTKQDFVHPIGTESLIIPFMGLNAEYKVNWYNALTGAFLGTGLNSCDEFGNFPLYFPLVSGDESRPILFFEMYRSDLSSFKTAFSDSLVSEKEALPYQIDSTVNSMIITNWVSPDIQVTLTPNPTSELISVQILESNSLNFTWSLWNMQGDEIKQGAENNENFTINFDDYPKGLYIFKLSDGTNVYTFKIVKS